MSYNGCNIINYSRINPHTGSGFILYRLLDGPMTKRAVYEGTRYGKWTPGYHSSIWAKLLDDGLIAADGGRIEVNIPMIWHVFSSRSHSTLRACGKRGAPIYNITDKGMKVLGDMFTRLNAHAR